MKTIKNVILEECGSKIKEALEADKDFSTEVIPLICFYLGKSWEENTNDAIAIINLVSHIFKKDNIEISSSEDEVFKLLVQKFCIKVSPN